MVDFPVGWAGMFSMLVKIGCFSFSQARAAEANSSLRSSHFSSFLAATIGVTDAYGP